MRVSYKGSASNHSTHPGSVLNSVEEELGDNYQDLDTGILYSVLCVEQREDEGLWLYIDSVPNRGFPSAFPAELFIIEDARMPENWHMQLEFVNGKSIIKRITYSDWTNDNEFFSRLIEGEDEAREVYSSWIAEHSVS